MVRNRSQALPRRITGLPDYASYLWNLIRESECWARRRVVSLTILSGDTLLVQASLDYDLNECEVGRRYLDALKRSNRAIDGNIMRRRSLANHNWSGPRALVLHYAYMRRWKPDKTPFPLFPNYSERGPKLFTRNWWRRAAMLLSWRPMKVTVPLINAQLCDSYHIELHTPEEIHIHKPDILTTMNPCEACQTRVVKEEENDLPPSHSYALVHHSDLKDKKCDGRMLVFRAWLALERRGVTNVLLFLAAINLAVAATLLLVFPFVRFTGDIFVPVQVLAAAVAFAYIYIPGEHELSRGLYGPVRWLLITTATLGLLSTIIVSILSANTEHKQAGFVALDGFDISMFWVAVSGVVAMFVITVVLFITWLQAKDSRIDKWIYKHIYKKMESGQLPDYWQYGWHTIGLLLGKCPRPATFVLRTRFSRAICECGFIRRRSVSAVSHSSSKTSLRRWRISWVTCM